MTSWTVSESHVDARLDLFIVEKTGKTRNAIQRAIKAGHIRVNGKECAVHRFLKLNDEVTWVVEHLTETSQTPILPENAPTILEETSDWLVLDKPAGLLVHPAHKHHAATATLVDWLLAKHPALAKVGEDPSRPGIVHRLDREVSGLMVVAKTQAAFDGLKQQFRGRTVEKRYLALVHNVVAPDEGDIKLRITRSTSKARMASRPQNMAGGKAAWTHYRVLERFKGATLLEITILSGRTHQIRTHMHAIGHPVIGDTLYARKQNDRSLRAPRLMLQSVHLEFNDPANEARMVFDLPPDQNFANLTKEFRIS